VCCGPFASLREWPEQAAYGPGIATRCCQLQVAFPREYCRCGHRWDRPLRKVSTAREAEAGAEQRLTLEPRRARCWRVRFRSALPWAALGRPGVLPKDRSPPGERLYGGWILIEQVPIERYLARGGSPRNWGAPARPAAALAAQRCCTPPGPCATATGFSSTDGYPPCADTQCQGL